MRHRVRQYVRKRFPHRIFRKIEGLTRNEWANTKVRPLSEPLSRGFFEWSESTPLLLQDIRQGRLSILNTEIPFSVELFWDDIEKASPSPLILETVHYHHFLLNWLESQGATDDDFDRVHSILSDWIRRYPPGKGSAWDPFTVAYRIQIWIRIARLPQPTVPFPDLARSLFQHGLYLERTLEFHLGGNHLWKDLSALLMLSEFFEGSTADRWFHTASGLLEKEIQKQILPDGGHYECSPMYHLLVMGDILDVRDLLQHHRPEWVEDQIQPTIDSMGQYIVKALHPDGEIPFFNDTVFGQAPAANLALSRMGNTSISTTPVNIFRSTGVTRIVSGELTLLFDGGPLGPDALMGHVHNDSLSIELSMGAHRFIVNRGVFEYTPGSKRIDSRSIHSHNTPCLDNFEQSEIWSSFRVAERWHRDRFDWNPQENPNSVSASWIRPGMPRISREVRIEEFDRIKIMDRFEGEGRHSLSSPFHFAPNIHLKSVHHEEIDGRLKWTWMAESESTRMEMLFDLPLSLRVEVEETVWWPRFYVEEPIERLLIRGEIECSDQVVLLLRGIPIEKAGSGPESPPITPD